MMVKSASLAHEASFCAFGGGLAGVSRKSNRHANCWNSPNPLWSVSAVLLLAICGLSPTAGYAYTAAGDRIFPATLILPQVAPSDAVWIPISTQPVNPALNVGHTRETKFTGTYSKFI